MGTAANLRDIRILAKATIDAIQITYENNGKIAWTPRYGGNGGDSNDVTFEEGEFLTYICGYYGPFRDMPNMIRSHTFVTSTNRTYGPYGEQQGTTFSNLHSTGSR
ncbi:jacalin-related lectin 3-like [Phoenix dactylifera]|uniref:Jacalin-related lectin 3-like n=1 Tax=Phoenix dactylifera TaxID=42345 RepID=A0A8B7MWC3_PHODC|nr:jacalin-related lectin 3-like [Phoenix dactylifera]